MTVSWWVFHEDKTRSPVNTASPCMPLLSQPSATPKPQALGEMWKHQATVGQEAMPPLPSSSCPSPHKHWGGKQAPSVPPHPLQKAKSPGTGKRHRFCSTASSFEPATAVQLPDQPWSLHELPLQFMLARAGHLIALDSQRKSCQCYFYLKPLFELHALILHT